MAKKAVSESIPGSVYTFKNQRNLEEIDRESRPKDPNRPAPIDYDEITLLSDYLKNGRKTNTVMADCDVVRTNDHLISVSNDGVIRDYDHFYRGDNLNGGFASFGSYTSDDCYAVILKDGTFLENGEDGSARFDGYATFSPTVLASLIEQQNVSDESMVSKLESIQNAKGLKVLDQTIAFREKASSEIRKAFTAAQKAKNFDMVKFNEKYRKSSPQRGATLVSDTGRTADLEWHSSPTVLFQHGSKHYILGQDEGSYFGCELAGKPKTVAEALIDLQPKEVRGKTGVMRQGEWFAVPEAEGDHSEDMYYDNPDVIALFGESNDGDQDYRGIVMPKENADSNDHVLTAKDGVILRDGSILARDFCMSQPEHADMMDDSGKNIWYKFYRNTAKASYSTQGVD